MENVESVCYIGEITNISPIEGADKIEQAKCGEWTCVVQKGIHSEGNKVLCITQDAVIPEHFAEKFGIKDYLRKRKRVQQLTVRTVKLKGVYSECILIPVKELLGQPDLAKVGTDMQDVFNIKKYEEPEQFTTTVGPNGKRIREKVNPNFHVYYKFPNAKNVTIFKEGDNVVITRKMHGTNARFGLLKKTKIHWWTKVKMFFGYKPKITDLYEFVYGSRQVQKGKGDTGFYKDDYWLEQARKLEIKKKMENFFWQSQDSLGNGCVIYGEIFGPGVQGEKYDYGLKERKFQIFDIMFVTPTGHDEYLPSTEWRACASGMGFTGDNMIEQLYEGPWSKEIEDKLSQGVMIPGTRIPHEGIVVEDESGIRGKMYKVINKDYYIFAEKHDVPDGH